MAKLGRSRQQGGHFAGLPQNSSRRRRARSYTSEARELLEAMDMADTDRTSSSTSWLSHRGRSSVKDGTCSVYDWCSVHQFVSQSKLVQVVSTHKCHSVIGLLTRYKHFTATNFFRPLSFCSEQNKKSHCSKRHIPLVQQKDWQKKKKKPLNNHTNVQSFLVWRWRTDLRGHASRTEHAFDSIWLWPKCTDWWSFWLNCFDGNEGVMFTTVWTYLQWNAFSTAAYWQWKHTTVNISM